MSKAEKIARALGNGKEQRSGDGWVTLCPCHDDHKPSMSIKDNEVTSKNPVLKCHAGCEFTKIKQELESINLWLPSDKRKTHYQRIWESSQKNDSDGILDKYIQSRGLSLGVSSPAIRTTTNLYHAETKTKYPGIVLRLSNEKGEGTGIHRVYLDCNSFQKASVVNNKKSLGKTKSSAIWLDPPSEEMFIGEGFETMLAVKQATNGCVLAALSASNLEKVSIPPKVKTVKICADLDKTETGQKAATSLADRLTREGRKVFIYAPSLTLLNDKKSVDWLDVLLEKGEAYIQKCFQSQVQHKIKVPKRNSIGIPKKFITSEDGVYYLKENEDGEKDKIKICSPLDVVAKTRSADSEEWGRLLELKDPDRCSHTWAMPMSMLSGDGSEYRQHLLNLGLIIEPGPTAKRLLTEYIQSASSEKRALCVSELGWHKNRFVLPNDVIGVSNPNELITYQGTQNIQAKYNTNGDLDNWRNELALLCENNSRLVFALSAAVAGPLLHLTGEESGGFHFLGPSSIGKTTLATVAGSVIGGDESKKGFSHTWRSTINALESLAAQHNDSLLILDEINQADPREVGTTAYMLANGRGKNRASRSGGSRKSQSWQLLFLSTGEESIATIASANGMKSMAGQEIRLIDIQADAGCNLGVFEDLHGFVNGDRFARHLNKASAKYFGVAFKCSPPIKNTHRRQ